MAAITVTDLHKTYGDNEAVRGVSFEVAVGEVYALLGHNGAGKSTVVEILEGHRQASRGTVSVLGFDPGQFSREFRDRIGIVLQTMTVEKQLTVRETVEVFGRAYRAARPTDEVIELVGLGAKANARVGTLSGGQKRRLDLAIGIVGNPELLFLDEPTTGFDPAARRQSWELVRELGAGGTTVLLTTHYLDEAEHLADRVGVLANGVLVAEGSPDELIDTVANTTIGFRLPVGVDAADFALPADATVDDRTVELVTDTPTARLAAITAAAVERGVELDDLTVRRRSLEDVFFSVADTPASDVAADATTEGKRS